MVRTRQAKVDGIARAADLDGRRPERRSAHMLVIGWGSTYGPITAAVRRLRATGRRDRAGPLRHLNPFPANLGEMLRRYDKVVVPEMNLGQLAHLLRAKYLVDARRRHPGHAGCPSAGAARRDPREESRDHD